MRYLLATRQFPRVSLLVGDCLPVALVVARALLCEKAPTADPCEACPSCHQSAHLSHPDLFLAIPTTGKEDSHSEQMHTFQQLALRTPYLSLSRWLTQITEEGGQPVVSAEQCRRVRHFAHKKPLQSKLSVAIIWGAELMGTSANILLKTLEEPPARCWLILATEEPGRLLPTVLSRCSVFTLKPVDSEKLIQWLQSQGYSYSQAKEATRLCRGLPSHALHILEQRGKLYEMAREGLKLATHPSPQLYSWLQKIEELSREEQITLAEWWLTILKERIHTWNGTAEPWHFSEANSIIESLIVRLTRNCSPQLAFHAALIELHRLSHKKTKTQA